MIYVVILHYVMTLSNRVMIWHYPITSCYDLMIMMLYYEVYLGVMI